MNTERINWDFQYHAPEEETAKRHEEVRAGLRQVAHLLDRVVPDSREKSLALTNLEQAMMWANAALARNPRPENAT